MSDSEALVRELAATVVDSYEKLELVVAAFRRSETLRIGELERAMRVHGVPLIESAKALAEHGVIEVNGDEISLARSSAWTLHVEALARLYEQDRIQVAMIMSEAAMERLRSKAARAFAEAFVIPPRKGERR